MKATVRQFWLMALIAGAMASLASGIASAQKAVAVPLAVAPNRWPDEQFEHWVFNQDGGSAQRARQRFETLLSLQVDEIDRVCSLSPEQKTKMNLLGQGDIKKIFDGYESAKLRFKQLDNDVQKLNEVMPDIRGIQTPGSPFESGSLFAKAIKHTLTEPQRAQYEALAKDRREFRHRAVIELAIETLEQSVPLRDAQRQELIAVLVKETKPMRTTGGYYDFYVIMDQMGRIPEEKLKALFSGPQWKAVTRLSGQYRNTVQSLRQSGYIQDDDDETPPAAGKK
jgi:hypothetical protein